MNRTEMLWSSEGKRSKMATRLSALRGHLVDIQRQKQTVSEYLYSNSESVGRVQEEVNMACQEEQRGRNGVHWVWFGDEHRVWWRER